MALVYCRQCGHQLSDQATVCPHCTYQALPSDARSTRSKGAWYIGHRLDQVPGWLLGIGVVMLLFVNAGTLAYLVFARFDEPTREVSQTSQMVHDRDGRLRVLLPPGWQAVPTSVPEAVLYAVDEEDQLVFFVYAEEKSALAALDSDYHQLDGYSGLLRQLLMNGMTGTRQGTPTRTTIGGFSAIQCLVSGELKGDALTFLVTVVETPKTFYQLRAVAAANQFEIFGPELVNLTASLQIIEPSTP